MTMYGLPLKDQLRILEEARLIFLRSTRVFLLCACIRKPLCAHLKVQFIPNEDLSKYIPLFTQKNAIKRSNGVKKDIWFENEWDRELFLEWMINDIKKRLIKIDKKRCKQHLTS
jgi:hypothetical protein